MLDTLTLTLIDSTGARREPTHQVQAEIDDPHTVWPHVLELAQNRELEDEAYAAEVALTDTGEVIYSLRCL